MRRFHIVVLFGVLYLNYVERKILLSVVQLYYYYSLLYNSLFSNFVYNNYLLRFELYVH